MEKQRFEAGEMASSGPAILKEWRYLQRQQQKMEFFKHGQANKHVFSSPR